MADISFGQDLWWMIPAIIVAAALTWWTYTNTVPALRGALRWVLPTIRFVCLSLILFLLFEPLLSRNHTIETSPLLAVLVDESESLRVTGGADTSATANIESVRSQLANFSPSGIPGNVRFFGFGTGTRPLGGTDSWADSIRFEEQRTNMSRALQDVRDDLVNENLRAVLVVSDGQHNSGRNPLFVAERYPVPILTAIVGDTTVRRDVYISSVVTNEIGYIDSELPVRAVVRSDGVEATNVDVSLLIDGNVVQTQSVRLSPGAENTVDLAFQPDAPGLRRVTVAVTRVADEVTYRNNTETVAVQVLDSKKRVHLLASSPGPDVASLRQILELDRNVELTVSVHRGGDTFYDEPLPDDLAEIDLLVLVGYPGRRTPPTQVAALAATIPNTMGVLFVLGRDTDLGKVNRYLSSLIPVQASTIRGEYLESTLALTASGTAHPVLESVGLSTSDWDRLPPVQYNTSLWRVSPDARVLATARIRNVTLPDPLVVVQERAGARSAAVMSAGTWRWKNLPEDLDAYSTVWQDVVSNMVVWLTADRDDRLVRVRPTSTSFAGTDPISFTGQVYDESLQPISDAAVEIAVRAPDGNTFPFAMDAAGNGRYTLETNALPGGSYTYTVTASRNGMEIGADEGSFVVGDLALEFRETRADPVLMRQIAQRSGGRMVESDALDNINEALAAIGTFEPRMETTRRETQLWRRYVFLALAVTLLTVEWFLRKRNGLV